MSKYILSAETGEILDEVRENDRLRIIRAESLEAIEDKYRVQYEEFCVFNVKELRLLLKELDQREKAVLISLFPFVQYSTCLLAHDNGVALTVKGISDITGMSRHTVENAVITLMAKDIICRVRNSKEVQYYINPILVHKGKFANKTLKAMFRNYKERGK